MSYYPDKCDRCELYKQSTARRRMNTAYVNDESNFTTQCDECFDKTQEEWQTMWNEYYGSRL